MQTYLLGKIHNVCDTDTHNNNIIYVCVLLTKDQVFLCHIALYLNHCIAF